jgi:hypothetical protein
MNPVNQSKQTLIVLLTTFSSGFAVADDQYFELSLFE